MPATAKKGAARVNKRRASQKPLVVTIDRFGGTVKRAITGGAPAIISRPAPRAG